MNVGCVAFERTDPILELGCALEKQRTLHPGSKIPSRWLRVSVAVFGRGCCRDDASARNEKLTDTLFRVSPK